MNKQFYITTPIYYVNASPHIGHAYTNIAADAITRFQRLKGNEAYFLTGTDEHGQKIQEAAKKKGVGAQEFVDTLVPTFKKLWQDLDINNSDFIRTTEKRHQDVVKAILNDLYKKGDIYEDEYRGWYCVPCEAFFTDFQVKEGLCPDCHRRVEEIRETNFFFRLSKYQNWLIEHIKANPDFIKPDFRRNEVLSFLSNPLNDLCITRPKSRIAWGIEVSFAKDHVVYVWFDALINYISGAGYLSDEKKFKSLWPADIHLMGKDIIRPHAVYWPIMLKAIGLEMPKHIFTHGWWMVGSEKMSKSRGNIADPVKLVEKYGTDALRCYLLKEVTFGLDGSYSEDLLVESTNSNLANDLGNFLNRTLVMIEKYFNSTVPKPGANEEIDTRLIEKAKALHNKIESAMAGLDLQGALNVIFELINSANKYIEDSKPWEINKQGKTERLANFMYILAEILRIVTISISPFMPRTACEMWRQLGMGSDFGKIKFSDIETWGLIKPGTIVKKGGILFPRIKIGV